MSKSRIRRLLIVLGTVLTLMMLCSTMPVSAASKSGGWKATECKGVKYKGNQIKKGKYKVRISKDMQSMMEYGGGCCYTKGKYVYMWQYSNDVGARIWAINMKSGKIKELFDSAATNMFISGKYLYYIQMPIVGYKVKLKIVRCSPMGKNKKILKQSTISLQKALGLSIEKLTKHSLVYSYDLKKYTIKF